MVSVSKVLMTEDCGHLLPSWFMKWVGSMTGSNQCKLKHWVFWEPWSMLPFLDCYLQQNILWGSSRIWLVWWICKISTCMFLIWVWQICIVIVWYGYLLAPYIYCSSFKESRATLNITKSIWNGLERERHPVNIVLLLCYVCINTRKSYTVKSNSQQLLW